jgi:hypothetical protein
MHKCQKRDLTLSDDCPFAVTLYPSPREDGEHLAGFVPRQRAARGEPGLLLRLHPAVLLPECTHGEVRGQAL